MSKPIRLLIVDDHVLFRDTLQLALSALPDFEIAGLCGSISAALPLLHSLPVDIVLLDYELGSERGTAFLPAARHAGFKGKVIIVTAAIPDAAAHTLIRQGVAGIFLKERPLAALLDGIRAVALGMTWLDQRYMLQILDGGGPPSDKFNPRELDVLRLVVEGLTNKQIADKLELSEGSVKLSLQRLFQKTGAQTRGHLVRLALEQYSDLL